MAEVKVIEVQIKSNFDGATSGASKLKKGLKDVSTQAVETTENVSKMSKAEGVINTVGDAVGKLNPAFGAAIKSANGLLLKMWELVANPWGAVAAGIVAVMKFLYEAFQSSVAGGKEIKTVFAGISAVGEQVKDAIFGLARALINVSTAAYKFITLDFKGAAEDIKKANKEASTSFEQLGDASDGTTFKIIKNIEKQKQANEKARKLQAVVQSETNKLLVQSREILTDETASINEKKKALAEVTKAEKASSAEKVRIAAEDLRLAKEAATAKGGQIEAKSKQQLRELTIALNEAETENAMTGIKLNKQKKMLGRQEVADAKEKNDAIAAINKEATDKRNAQLKLDADTLKAFQSDVLKNQQQMNVEKVNSEIQNKIDEKLNQEERLQNISNNIDAIDALNQKEIDNEKLKRDKKIQDEIESEKRKNDAIASSKQNLNNIIAGLEASGLAKTKAGQVISKAIALTQIGIDSAIAISKASTLANAEGVAAQLAFPTLPGIGTVARVLSYASTAASVIGNISRARQLLSSGGSGGGASTSPGGGGGGGGVTAAPPAFNVVGASATNQLAQTIGQKEQQPVKAYVVSNDVTTAQSLNRNIISSATLG